MRRLLAVLAASAGLAGAMLVLPVSSAPRPEPVPVTTSSEEVVMGSVSTPAPEVEVQQGTTEPVSGVPEDSPVLTLTQSDAAGFSLVGVTWAYDPAVTDTVVQVRVQDGSGSWTSWTEIQTEGLDRQQGAGGEVRGGTAPLWTGPSTGVQAELVTRSGARPTDVRIELIDPGTSPADAALGEAEIQDTADAAMAIPPVYSRNQWGADPALRSWGPQYAPTLKAATVHHTADSNNYTAADVPAIMRSIYRYHAVSLRWGDIGYHVVVDKFGRLWEGRDGGLASTVIGAHAGGFNTGTFGVSMLGNYDVVDTTEPMIDAVSAIIAWKFSLYGIDPRGSVTLTSGGGGTSRYAAGQKATVPTVFAHRDVGNTACPGRYGFARMGEIRTQVHNRTVAAMTPIERRYAADPGLRAVLGEPVGTEQSRNGASWQVYAGGRLYWSQAGGVRLVVGAILDKYLALGGPDFLGAPISDDARTADGRGVFVRFPHGDIYWSPNTGTQLVRGSILATWLSRGGAVGHLGLPTTSDASTSGGRGAFVRFEGGGIYWSPGTGTQVVVGAILGTWLESGGPDGPLGFPTTTDALTADRRGAFVRFQGGDVYWSRASGTQIVRGSILTTWLSRGGATGHLGFPTTSDAATADGRGYFVRFQGGDVYWSPTTGTHVVVGAILSTWLEAGGPAGRLGFPTTTDALTADRRGAFVRFQGGDVYWSPTTGSRIVWGAILTRWQSYGGATGGLGFPTTSVARTPDGSGYFTRFERGDIYWSAATGPRAVVGGILATWLADGGSSGPLGYPKTSDSLTADRRGAFVRFQGGDVYWSPTTGVQIVRGALATAYATRGGPASSLGFPTRTSYEVPGGLRSDFERGSLTWNRTTGSVTAGS